MATIKDIAAYTGVSPTTVSNVIHGRSGRVSEETVHKIQDAIEKLDMYQICPHALLYPVLPR